MTKLLVANGYNSGILNPILKSVEVINLDESNPNLICDNLPDLPTTIHRAIGHLYVKTTPIICGGYTNVYSSECHTFVNGTWMSSPSLNEARGYSASVIFSSEGRVEDDIILITGGQNNVEGVLSTVESFDGQIWNETMFADLPTTILLHCMVKINNSMLMLIGGTIDNYYSGLSI